MLSHIRNTSLPELDFKRTGVDTLEETVAKLVIDGIESPDDLVGAVGKCVLRRIWCPIWRIRVDSHDSKDSRSPRTTHHQTPLARTQAPQRPSYMALNSSNGCKHARHQHTDLHAVDPNSLRTSVSRESQ